MKTVDVSGMGGGYENVCQQMLKNGFEFLDANPGLDWDKAYKGYQGIYGIVTPESEPARKLDEAIMKGIEDATGAMHQCVVSHLLYVAKNGRDQWLSKIQPDRIFEWDGTAASCPKTELSERMERARS